MQEMSYLKLIEQMLKEEQFDCTLVSETEAPPFGKLLLFLGQDEEEQERILEITAQHQELGEAVKMKKEQFRYMRTQFELFFPFKVKASSSNEVASLLSFINRMLELPGFEFDEVQERVAYRYVLLSKGDQPDKMLFEGIIGVVLLFCKMFASTIEQVAQGKQTFNDLLEQILQLSEDLKKG